eukprot:SAG31_NODE_519_length_14648_cov_24.224895_1_plen_3530_part_00
MALFLALEGSDLDVMFARLARLQDEQRDGEDTDLEEESESDGLEAENDQAADETGSEAADETGLPIEQALNEALTGFAGTPPNQQLFPPQGPDTTGGNTRSTDLSFDRGGHQRTREDDAQFDGLLDDLFEPQKLVRFPHTVRSQSNESLDALEQILYANVYNRGLTGPSRKKLAWQLNEAVRQAATEHGEAADVLLSQLKARAVMLKHMSLQWLSETKVSGYKTFRYAKDMDKNGLFYFLGTDRVPHHNLEWKNPATTGAVQVKVSPMMDSGQEADFLSRDRVRMLTKSNPEAFIKIDLVRHKFRPTHYTIRAASGDSGGHYLRNFRFQGSNNDQDWHTLHSCANDIHSFKSPYEVHTFKIEQQPVFYRFFRVQLTGRTSHSNNRRHCLSLCGFELYGQLPFTIEDEAQEQLARQKEPPISNKSAESAPEVSAAFTSCIANLIASSFSDGIENMDSVKIDAMLDIIAKFTATLPRSSLANSSELRSHDISDRLIDTIETFLQIAFQHSGDRQDATRRTIVSCIVDLALRRGELRCIGKAELLLKTGDSGTEAPNVDQGVNNLRAYVLENLPDVDGTCLDDVPFDATGLLIDPHEHSLRFVADLLEITVRSFYEGSPCAWADRIVAITMLTKANVDAVLATKMTDGPKACTAQKLMKVSRLLCEKSETIDASLSASGQEPELELQDPQMSSEPEPAAETSPDSVEADQVADYAGEARQEGVLLGRFSGHIRFRPADKLIIVNLRYTAVDPAEDRRTGGPRHFDLTWDPESGAVGATPQCTQDWKGNCGPDGVLSLVDKDGTVITLTACQPEQSDARDDTVEVKQKFSSIASSLLESVAKLCYQVEDDRAAYVTKMLEQKNHTEDKDQSDSDQIVFNATLGEINSISTALRMFNTGMHTDPSKHFSDSDRMISSIELMLEHETKNLATCLPQHDAERDSRWPPINHIGAALQNMQAALIAISVHEPEHIAPNFVSKYSRLLARFCGRMIDLAIKVCVFPPDLITSEKLGDEALRNWGAKQVELFEKVTHVLKHSCVGLLLHPWLVALDLIPWDLMEDQAVADLHVIEARIGELLAMAPQHLSQVGPQHKTLAVKRILESPHFVGDQVIDFKVSVRMPGAAEVVVTFDPRCNISTNSSLTLSPLNNPNSESTMYGENGDDWSKKAIFTANPDGVEFVYGQQLERGRRYYGWKCEVIGTAVGEKLPFIADLHSSLTHVLGGHALKIVDTLPIEGPCLLYVKGIDVDLNSIKLRRMAQQLCKTGDLADVGVVHTASRKHACGFIRLGSLEDFENVKSNPEEYASLLGEGMSIEVAHDSNVFRWLRSPLLQHGITSDDTPERQLASSIFQGSDQGRELLQECEKVTHDRDSSALARSMSSVATTALRKIFAVLLYHLGGSKDALLWLEDEPKSEVPHVVQDCYKQAMHKVAAYQRGQMEELQAPTQDQEEYLLTAITHRLEFLLSICPATSDADHGAPAPAPVVDSATLSPTLSTTSSALRVVQRSSSVYDELMTFIFDVQVDVQSLRSALDSFSSAADNLLSQMKKAQESLRVRNEYESAHEAECGLMPALSFQRLVCSQLLQLRPGTQSRQYSDLIRCCGKHRQALVVDAAHQVVTNAVNALSTLEGAEPSSPEPEVEPEFKWGDEGAIAAVQELGCSRNVAMWALFEMKHRGQQQTLHHAKEWAISARGPPGLRGPEYDNKSLPKDAFIQPGNTRGPLSATKDTQAQCVALVACSVIWTKTDSPWLTDSDLFERLLSAALLTTPALKRLYWALLNSVVLTLFTADGDSTGSEATAALQSRIISSLLKQLRLTDASETSNNREEARRTIALLATCFPSEFALDPSKTHDSISESIRVLSEMVVPTTGSAAAPEPQPAFKYENDVGNVVSMGFSENVARYMLYKTQGDITRAVERLTQSDINIAVLEVEAAKPLPKSAFVGAEDETSQKDVLAQQLVDAFRMVKEYQIMPIDPGLEMTSNAAMRALHFTNTDAASLDDAQVQGLVAWFLEHANDPDINNAFEPPVDDDVERVVYEYTDGGRWIPYDDDVQQDIHNAITSGAHLYRLHTNEGRRYTLDLRRMLQINEMTGTEREFRGSRRNGVVADGNAFQLDSTEIKTEILATLRRVFAATSPAQCAHVLQEIRPKMANPVIGESVGSTVVSLFLQNTEVKIATLDRFALGLLIQLSHCPSWSVELQEFVRVALSTSAADVKRGEVTPVCSMALALNGGLGEIVRVGADVRLEDGDARVIKFKQGRQKATVSMAESSFVKEVELQAMSPFCSFNIDVALFEPMLPVARELLQQAQTGIANVQIMHAVSLAVRAIGQHIMLFPEEAMPQLISAQLVPMLFHIALLSLETLKSKGSKNISQFLHELEESAAAICYNIGSTSASQMIKSFTNADEFHVQAKPEKATSQESLQIPQGNAEATDASGEIPSTANLTKASDVAVTHETMPELGMWTTGFMEHEGSHEEMRAAVASSFDSIESNLSRSNFGRTRSGVGIDRALIWKRILRVKNAEKQLLEDYSNLARFSAIRAMLMLLEQPLNDRIYNSTNSESIIRLLHIAMMTDFSPKVKLCLENMIAIDSMSTQLEAQAVQTIRSTQFRPSLGPITQTLSAVESRYSRQRRNHAAVNYMAKMTFDSASKVNYSIDPTTRLADEESLTIEASSSERGTSQSKTVVTSSATVASEFEAASDVLCVTFDRSSPTGPSGRNGWKLTAVGNAETAHFECRNPSRGSWMEGSIHIEGASGLFVRFDQSCELGDGDRLIFSRTSRFESSRSRFTRHDSGSLHKRPMTMTGCNELHFYYEVGSRDKWGVRFSVRAKTGLDPVSQAHLDLSLLGMECILERRAALIGEPEPEVEPEPEIDITVKSLDKSKAIKVRMPRSGTIAELSQKINAADMPVKKLVFDGQLIFPGDAALERKTLGDLRIEPSKAVICIQAKGGAAGVVAKPIRNLDSQLAKWANVLTNAARRVPGEPRRKLLRLLTKTVAYATEIDVELPNIFEPLRVMLCHTYDMTAHTDYESTKYFGSPALQALVALFTVYRQPEAIKQISTGSSAFSSSATQWIEMGLTMRKQIFAMRVKLDQMICAKLKPDNTSISADLMQKMRENIWSECQVVEIFALVASDEKLTAKLKAVQEDLEKKEQLRLSREEQRRTRDNEKQQRRDQLLNMFDKPYQVEKALSCTTGIEAAVEFILSNQEEHPAEDPFWRVEPDAADVDEDRTPKSVHDLFNKVATPLAELQSCYAHLLSHQKTDLADATRTIEEIVTRATNGSGQIKLNTGNRHFHQRVGCKPGGTAILKALGFEQSGNNIEMTVVPESLAILMTTLKQSEWQPAAVDDMLRATAKAVDQCSVQLGSSPVESPTAPLSTPSETILSPLPLSQSSPFFEIELGSTDVEFSVGSVHICFCHSVSGDGWDGEIRSFDCSADPYMAVHKDRVGLGLEVGFDGAFTGVIVFTKNGKLLAKKPMDNWDHMRGAPVHPCITFKGNGAAATIQPQVDCSDCMLSENHSIIKLLPKTQVNHLIKRALLSP